MALPGLQQAGQDLSTEPVMDQVRQRIFRIKRLAGMPHVVWRLMDALSDEDVGIRELSHIIESDQALTSKVLSLANSAYYGFSQQITTVERAAVLIGFQELQMLALGAGLSDVFDVSKVPPGFDGEGLWLHCFAVSWLARELALVSDYPAPGEAMIAGLLHDLGKLVLATHVKDEFSKIIELESQGVPYSEAEKRLKLSHTQVGYWLAKRWDLPELYLEAIRYHHAPSPQLPYYHTTYLVYLANRVAKNLGYGLVQSSQDHASVAYTNAIDLPERKLRSVIKKAQGEIPPNLERMKGWLRQGG
jgi:putative nucleotidyltransferase with HDIG domain